LFLFVLAAPHRKCVPIGGVNEQTALMFPTPQAVLQWRQLLQNEASPRRVQGAQ
jgi:hypothetical protein